MNNKLSLENQNHLRNIADCSIEEIKSFVDFNYTYSLWSNAFNTNFNAFKRYTLLDQCLDVLDVNYIVNSYCLSGMTCPRQIGKTTWLIDKAIQENGIIFTFSAGMVKHIQQLGFLNVYNIKNICRNSRQIPQEMPNVILFDECVPSREQINILCDEFGVTTTSKLFYLKTGVNNGE